MNTPHRPSSNGQFLFVCCQIGAEAALKHDVSQRHPGLVFAFSRPGFVTFKVVDATSVERIESPFARTFGVHLANVRDATPASAIAATLAEHAQHASFDHLHVWTRDAAVPGDRGFEPFATPASLELGKAIIKECSGLGDDIPINKHASTGAHIADVIVVDEGHWFVGHHLATSTPRAWPGGVPLLTPHEAMVSRAYLKMEEALRWSRLPIHPGDVCVELGSSPGGSCQALLERGAKVMGIDPAVMDPRVREHPDFTHVRARAADLKRKEFANVRWLMADANIAPTTILDSVEAIVTNRRVHIPGMLLTLKLLDWKMAKEIDSYLERIRSWGYRYVRARQLAFNRREICVLASRSKDKLRLARRRKPASV